MPKNEIETVAVDVGKPETIEVPTANEHIHDNKDKPQKSQSLLMVIAITISILLAGSIFVMAGCMATQSYSGFRHNSNDMMVFGRQDGMYMRRVFVQNYLF